MLYSTLFQKQTDLTYDSYLKDEVTHPPTLLSANKNDVILGQHVTNESDTDHELRFAITIS